MSSAQQSESNLLGVAMSSNSTKISIPEAKSSSKSPSQAHLVADAAENAGQQFHDSGFFESADYAHDDYPGNKDFILYESQPEDLDYMFADEDAYDIASIKANHGSIYDGTNNQSTAEIQPATSYRGVGSSGEDIPLFDSNYNTSGTAPQPQKETELRAHRYSNFDRNMTGLSPCEKWAIPDRHDPFSYPFQPPRDPSRVFDGVQMSQLI